MNKFDEAVKRWAVAQVVDSTSKHLMDCPLDSNTVRDVKFETRDGGGCETCWYTYITIAFRASCRCGKIRDKTFDVVNSESTELPDLIADIMQYEPVEIEEHPV